MSSRKADQSIPTAEERSSHDLHRSIVTIFVSPEHYPFHLHKGRLCQHSYFFEKAFHGSLEEATTGSMYLEEDGVDELSYPRGSVDPSLLLVKLLCFEKVGISKLQNATLDAIRDRAVGKEASPDTDGEIIAEPQSLFAHYLPPPVEDTYPTITTSSGLKRAAEQCLPPATSSAIHYAYHQTPQSSPLRKLLADIFAFNVKPQTWDESLLTLPVEFMADVIVINMRRLPLRLENEKADFDLNATKYHVEHPRDDRRSRASQVVKDGALDGPAIGDDDENDVMSVPVSRDAPRRETLQHFMSFKSAPHKPTKILSMSQ